MSCVNTCLLSTIKTFAQTAIPSLSSRQKLIMVVVSSALGLIAATYLAIRFCNKLPKPSDAPTPLDSPSLSPRIPIPTLLKSQGDNQRKGDNLTEKQTRYLRAIQSNPSDSSSYSNLGFTLPSGGSIQLLGGALMTQQDLYLKAIDLDPNDSKVYSILGAALPPGGSIMLFDGRVLSKQQLLDM